MSIEFQLIINNRGNIQDATELCEGEITVETQRRGSPAKLTFNIYRFGTIDYHEGNEVTLKISGKTIFKGYIFRKHRTKDQIIETTAYDQMIYLKKNKETYVYTNKTASEVLRMVAEDYNLKLGHIADTGYAIPARSEDIQTLIDIIYNALDLTVINTGTLFVLYDDAGGITLKQANDMKLDKLLSADNTLIDYQYTTDIETETYNKVKLYRDNQESGVRDAFIAQDSGNMSRWGILQLQEKMDENLSDAQMIDLVERKLALYNKVKRTLSVEELNGDAHIRAGCTILIEIADIGDISIRQWMMVDKCTHTITDNQHTMKLDFTGDIG